MKEYKFIAHNLEKEASNLLNKHIKKGWKLEEWKVNDNVIIILLSKECSHD